MKRALIVSILSLLLFNGCHENVTDSSDSDGNDSSARAISERELLESDTAVSEKTIVILSMESPYGDDEPYDTQERGTDCFSFVPTKNISDAAIVIEPASIVSSVVVTDTKSGESVEATRGESAPSMSFVAGREYRYCAEHDAASEISRALFVFFDKMGNPADGTLKEQSDIDRLVTTNDCINCNLEHANLTEMNLTDANLSGAKMQYAILSGADLTHADLEGARLFDVELSYANLSYTVIDDIHFSYTRVSHAIFRYTDFPDGFSFADNPSKAQSAPPYYKRVDFTGANLSGTVIENSNLSYAILREANLTGLNLFDTNFSHADLEAARMEHIIHVGESTDLSYANIDAIALETFETLSLAGANIDHATYNLFTFVYDESPDTNYSCAPLPYLSKGDEAYLCSRYGDLDMHIYTLEEYEEKMGEEEWCSQFEILSYGGSTPMLLPTYICFPRNGKFHLYWEDSSEIKEGYILQRLENTEYRCGDYMLSGTCRVPSHLKFRFSPE